jgi:alcohol dehydrogenase class IV
VDTIRDGALAAGADAVVAVGGGSVLDTGKAVAAMCLHSGSVEEYLEGVGEKKPEGRRLPLIAVPTTAGTGSEATKNAVISRVGENGYKKSLRHDAFVPDMAVIDPRAGLSVPPQVTAAAGMDAVTQLLEAYVSTDANPFTDAVAVDGLHRAGYALPGAVRDGGNLDAKAEMAYAAYLSGVALANAGLGLVHGYASSLGALHPVPHGVVCAILVGPVTRAVADALSSGNDEASLLALEKYAHAASVLEGAPSPYTGTNRRAVAEPEADGEERREQLRGQALRLASILEGWREEFSLPSLADYGFSEEELRASGASAGLKKTPATLSEEARAEIAVSSVRV